MRVTVPVLVIWGEADRMIPVEHGRAYAKAIPDARFRAPARDRAPAPARDARPPAAGGLGLRERHLRDMTDGGQPPSAELIAEVMARYATEPA